MNESKRVRTFRLIIAKQIPKFPNDKASLQALEAKSFGSLLIDYANWAIRYIAPRPRTVIVESTVQNDPKWRSSRAEIQALLEKVKAGDDLTPYLSLQPHTRGYTPASSAPGADVDRWADKDMLLNVTGYHHLHLDAAPNNQMRSDDLIFAHVTRDMFKVVGLFNHKVFEKSSATSSDIVLTEERARFWQTFDEHSMRGAPTGSVVISTAIASSGHSLHLTFLCMKYARTVNEIDPKLDDPAYVQSLYKDFGMAAPAKLKLRWHFQFLTLGLLDADASVLFTLCKGPN